LTPDFWAQLAQQKNVPLLSTPWPMILQPQWAHWGASAWIAHSKESKTCGFPFIVTVNDLS
jgi:hypothetical protein